MVSLKVSALSSKPGVWAILTSYWLEVTRAAVLHVCPWILKIATQDYTVAPVVANFTPVHRSTRLIYYYVTAN